MMFGFREFVAVAGVVAMAAGTAAAQAPQLGQAPIKDVIAAMTKEEKASLVNGMGMQVPGITNGDMAPPSVGETQNKVPGAAGTTFAIPRLGIPSIVLADGPAGLRIQPVRNGDTSKTFYCTAFPIETLLASSWDTDLVERVGKAMGNEVKEYGVDVLLGPALNTHRNPLGGRNYEYYSEDPVISGKMAAAMVRGVQAEGVGTSVKHFAANDHEWNRMTINVLASQRALREIYLRAFEIVIREAKPWTVMSSYNKLNWAYTSETPQLLQDTLRKDWQFTGLVMTDWFGGRDAVKQMNAGNELLMPGTERQRKAVLDGLASGALKEEVLDRNVAVILELILRSPTFQKYAYSNTPDLKAHAQVARAAAADGMVLLRNQATLPLATTAKLALFGNTSYDMITGGTGSGDVNEAYSVSMVDGLKGAGLTIDAALAERYQAYLTEQEKQRPAGMAFMPRAPIAEMAPSAEDIARAATDNDAALVTLGRRSGEFFDRKREGDFELTATERAVIQDVAKAFHAKNKKVVVVLNIGGVIETVTWRDTPDAILLAWQPGQESGNAIADVLTGKVAPSGRLASTFPVKWEDVPSSANFPGKTLIGPDPNAKGIMSMGDRAAEVSYDDEIYVGYRYFATKAVKTAYPFGYGLSYTTFVYSGLKLSAQEFGKGLTATVNVKNTGKVPGRDVAQLYLSAPGIAMAKPAIELKGFAKTKILKPGETETVSFTLAPRDLASFEESSSAWVIEGGTYTIQIGASSEDLRLKAHFTKASADRVEGVASPVVTYSK
jgi:beta-glucosidase